MKKCILLIILLFLLFYSCKQTPEPVYIPVPEPIPEPESEPEPEPVKRIKITIAGFNMDRLQDLTSSVPMTKDAIVQVISGYDIVIIHGLSSSMENLVKNINELINFNAICDYTYDYAVSSRTGREQGAVFYNSFDLELVNTIVLNSRDRYSTQPFILFFRIVESGQIFSIFCFESGPGRIMNEAAFIKDDFSKISSDYEGIDYILLCDLESAYTELEGFPDSYSLKLFEDPSSDLYNTFDCLFLPPKFNEADTAFTGIRYFNDIIDNRALDLSSSTLADFYLVWMELYF
jgi:hypothetical protein